MLSGRILITGGTGSLGTAILHRAERENWPAVFTILARNETKMNKVVARFPYVKGLIGDVRDHDWLKTVFPGHGLIIHAAALKIVPVAESTPTEAIKTNVVGSMNVVQAAIESKIKKVIGISTDKACGPTYYGLTKRLMEGTFRQACEIGSTDFVLCRYGNVLRSANSIVPLFEKQIRTDKPFTITHLGMTRFWLSMEDAINLIIRTVNNAKCGQIFVPKAPAMSIKDLALALDPFREIQEIGIRAGERLHETLIVQEEALHTVEKDDHFIIYPPKAGKIMDSLPIGYEYTSENPAHVLSNDELFKMLDESREDYIND